MTRWGEIKCPRCAELKKAMMSDADIAQARRYYMHVQEGGTLTARDVGRMVEAMEVMQAKMTKAEDFIRRLERFAVQNKDGFLTEKAQEALAELTGGEDA